MKSMRPSLAAIFSMTYFHKAGGGAWSPLDPLLDFSSELMEYQGQCQGRLSQTRLLHPHFPGTTRVSVASGVLWAY